MKKICLLAFIVLGTVLNSYSQTNNRSSARHELHINGFNLAAYKAPNLSYEYLLDENMSLGLGFLYKLDRGEVQGSGFGAHDMLFRVYSLTPYFRRYLSKSYALGFFIEGFGMLHSGEILELTEMRDDLGLGILEPRSYTHFASGFTFGGKFIFGKSGILFEFHFGLGTDIISGNIRSNLGPISRGGISLGYRF